MGRELCENKGKGKYLLRVPPCLKDVGGRSRGKFMLFLLCMEIAINALKMASSSSSFLFLAVFYSYKGKHLLILFLQLPRQPSCRKSLFRGPAELCSPVAEHKGAEGCQMHLTRMGKYFEPLGIPESIRSSKKVEKGPDGCKFICFAFPGANISKLGR